MRNDKIRFSHYKKGNKLTHKKGTLFATLKKILRVFRHPKKRTEEIRFQLDKKRIQLQVYKKTKIQ